MTLQHQLQAGWLHHQRGQWVEAEKVYNEILAEHPQHAEAMHLLGMLAAQTGRFGVAIELFRRCIAISPDRPAYYINLGAALTNSGRIDEAIAVFRQVVALRPDSAAAHCNLGNALKEKGLLSEAIAECRQAIALRPDFAEAHSNLSSALRERGQFEAAIAAARQAVALKPDLATAHVNLGNALLDNEQPTEAATVYREAVRLAPAMAWAHSNLGIALAKTGRLDDAIAACRQAIALKPDFAEAYSNLGNALREKDHADEAIAEYQRAIHFKPGFAEAHSNMGIALKDKGYLDQAIARHRHAILLKPGYAQGHTCLGVVLKESGQLDQAVVSHREAVRLSPGYAEAHSNLGSALHDLGQLDEAIACYRKAIQLQPDLAEAHGNLLFTANYSPDMTAQAVFAEHQGWAARHAPPSAHETIRHDNERSPDRRLRIGYVSPDFRRHSVAFFLIPLLEHHDPRSVETFCYSNVRRADDFTVRIKQCCDAWRNIVGLSNEAAIELIRRDGIDILVDLSGHTSESRIRLFAYKPAPVQVTYLGYPNTTGMTAIDYRLTDALADPPGMNDELNVEKLWRLPTCAWCYEPPKDTPTVEPRGEGPITFGCFNAFAKINHKIIAMWAQVLHRMPGSRLLLKSAGAGEISSRRRLIGQFAELGISSDRIELLGRTADFQEHLKLYGRIDVALDTYPYHGTTTTCEAFWMGVPVVSLAGPAHVARVGASLLTHAGLAELIAQTPDRYVEIAAALAQDPRRLGELRRTLRAQLQASPLMDAARFAGDVEDAYRKMWRIWCKARSD
jgi:predicted O-linked N-acetylglucosamine transferase (SPINDLY family)